MLAAFGPGLVVMLADTDAGSLLTAAQSGSRWGYALVLPELALIPVLYLVQEMTVRLGLVTGRGHGELIREHFGARWAVCSSITLLSSAVGALLTEFVGVAAAAALFGVPRRVSVPVAAAVLISLAFSGRYRRIERVALAFGLGELLFVPALVFAHPHLGTIAADLRVAPLSQRSYLYLLAANVGAVIMPWMIFYQQGAVIQRGLRVRSLRAQRLDTALGTVVTQVVMVTVVLLAATSLWHRGGGPNLSGVTQLAAALRPELGAGSRFVVGAAVIGAAMVAAVVVSLAGSWGLAEALGWRHSLNSRPDRASAAFYATYVAAHLFGALVVLSCTNLVQLAVGVEVMNAVLLPVVLGFLLALEARALPAAHRMRGARRLLATCCCVAVMAFGLAIVPALVL